MSAPAALAISKVVYPETKRAPLAEVAACEQVKSPYHNVLEAAMVGAMDSIPIVAGIAANLIAFLSIYDFFNQTLTWLGYRAGMTQNLTFEVSATLFSPIDHMPLPSTSTFSNPPSCIHHYCLSCFPACLLLSPLAYRIYHGSAFRGLPKDRGTHRCQNNVK